MHLQLCAMFFVGLNADKNFLRTYLFDRDIAALHACSGVLVQVGIEEAKESGT